MTEPEIPPSANADRKVPGLPDWISLAGARMYGGPDDVAFMKLLITSGCPIVCIGRRDPDREDWHKLCEDKAVQAFDLLRGLPTLPDYGHEVLVQLQNAEKDRDNVRSHPWRVIGTLDEIRLAISHLTLGCGVMEEHRHHFSVVNEGRTLLVGQMATECLRQLPQLGHVLMVPGDGDGE